MPNRYEQAARHDKAERIVAVFREHGGTAQDALELDEEAWGNAAKLAGVRLPSVATREEVVRILGE